MPKQVCMMQYSVIVIVRRVVLMALVIVGGAINGTYGGAVVSGIVFCDQCKDGRVSLFDYPLSGVKVAMLCPGTDTQMEMVGQETTNMFGGYTMRFDGSPDLSGCYAQVNAAAGGNGEADSSSCQASAGPAESLRLTFSFFGMEFYAVNVLISQPAQPLSFCPGSHESRPSPTAPPVVVIPPTPPLAPPVVVNPPTPPAPPSQSPPKAPAFRLPPMPPLPPLPSMPPMPFLEASACSHEYWMMPEYRCYWRVLNPDMKVGLIFGPLASDKYGTDMTLWEGLQGRADPYRTLLREGITALLNSYNSFQFPYTSLGVVQSLNLALMDTPQTTLLTALRFMRANSGYSDANSNPSCKLKSCKS